MSQKPKLRPESEDELHKVEFNVFKKDAARIDAIILMISRCVEYNRLMPLPRLIRSLDTYINAVNTHRHGKLNDEIWDGCAKTFKFFQSKKAYNFVVEPKKESERGKNQIIFFGNKSPFTFSVYQGTTPLRHIILRVAVEWAKDRHINPEKFKKHTDNLRFFFLVLKSIINDEYKQDMKDYKIIVLAGMMAVSFGWDFGEKITTVSLHEKAEKAIRKIK